MLGTWKTLMAVWCWAVVIFGVLLAGAGFPATDGPAKLLFAVIGAGTVSPDFLEGEGMRFAVGLMGALTIGLGMLIRVAAYAAGGDRSVWRALVLSVGVWYVVDSAISVSTGFPLNALSNTVIFGSFLAIIFGAGMLRANEKAATA